MTVVDNKAKPEVIITTDVVDTLCQVPQSSVIIHGSPGGGGIWLYDGISQEALLNLTVDTRGGNVSVYSKDQFDSSDREDNKRHIIQPRAELGID